MIDVDTTKLKNDGETIVKLSNDFNDLCNKLYSRIYNMPYNTQEWMGVSAVGFAGNAMNDKKYMVDFKNELYEFGKKMIDFANTYDLEITKNK